MKLYCFLQINLLGGSLDFILGQKLLSFKVLFSEKIDLDLAQLQKAEWQKIETNEKPYLLLALFSNKTHHKSSNTTFFCDSHNNGLSI